MTGIIKPTRSAILVVAVAFIITVGIAADALWLPYKRSVEIYSHDYPERSRTSATRSYYSYILRTTADKEYLIPTPVVGYLAYKDTIFVGRSYFFNKPSEISWCSEENNCYRMGISIFHNDTFFYLLAGSVIILAFLTLVPFRFGREKSFPYQYLLLTVAIAGALFYLVFSFN